MDRLKEIELRKAAIAEESKTATGEKLTALSTEIEALTTEEKELREAITDTEKRQSIADKLQKGVITGKKIEKDEAKRMENTIDSMEYRKAFMDYVLKGEMPEEFRAAAYSTTSDNAAVIPPATLNKIIEKMESYGNILPLVRKLSYPAGLVVPTSTLAATASWIQEGAAIDPTAKTTAKITFGAYELAAAIGISFKAHIQSLSAFEAAITENVARAMTKALEESIIKGDGTAKPTGILKATPAKTVVLNAKIGYNDIINIVKAIPAAYKTNTVLTMNENTFYSFIGITDSQGQPIARTNFGLSGEPSCILLGKKVVCTDHLPDFDSADASATVAYAFNYDNYVLNTAYQMDLVTYIENATRNKVYQSVGMYDGKVVDANGLVFINKAAK